MTYTFKYANKFRPVSFCTLPDGIEWKFVENPQGSGFNNGLQESANYKHGVIATNRKMTPAEKDCFGYIEL